MFKTIERYPDYEISKTGDIRQKETKNLRKPYIDSGRKKIKLTYQGKKESVSRLVAETYIPNPENKPVVRHIDGDKENDDVDNLEWVDKSIAQRDSYGLGIFAPGGNTPAKTIMIIETGEIFPSIRACARAIGGSPSGIRQCLNSKIETYKGFTFKILA